MNTIALSKARGARGPFGTAKLWKGSAMPAKGARHDARMAATRPRCHQLAGLSERTLRDFEVTGADAIYLSNKSFWKV